MKSNYISSINNGKISLNKNLILLYFEKYQMTNNQSMKEKLVNEFFELVNTNIFHKFIDIDLDEFNISCEKYISKENTKALEQKIKILSKSLEGNED